MFPPVAVFVGGTWQVSVVELFTAPTAAWIVDVPAVTQFAGIGELIEVRGMVATAVLELVQVACVVTSCFEPSENVPVAVNCTCDPLYWVGLVGVTAILESVGAGDWQVITVFPEKPLVAVIVTAPGAMHLTVWVAVFGVALTVIV